MRRSGECVYGAGRWGRIRAQRVVGVVRCGEAMVRGRSGREVVKRIMRVRGGMEGGGEVVVVDIDVCWFGWVSGVGVMQYAGGLYAKSQYRRRTALEFGSAKLFRYAYPRPVSDPTQQRNSGP